MDPGTPIAVITLSAKVLSTIWTYYWEAKNARSDITALTDEIRGSQDVLQKVEDLLSRSSRVSLPASLETTLKQAQLDLTLIDKQIDPSKGTTRMRLFGKRALKWPFTKKEVEEWIARFDRLKTSINLALNTDSASLIINTDSTVTQLKDVQITNEQTRLLAQLPNAASASFDSYYRQHEPECLENTRVELLHSLQKWGGEHQRKIFWLSGMAGTGKSTISRTLANRFKMEKTLGANFFFSRASGEANNAANLVGTLAYQLANKVPALRPFIWEAISLNEDVLRQGLRNQWKELILIPLSKASISGYPTMNIIIDALDECGSDDEIRIILQLLVEVKSLKAADLGVFVTSRPEVIIRLGFAAMPEITHYRLDLRDIPRSIVQRDISILLESEFDNIRRQHKLRDWPTQHDRQILVERSDCLFIYAKTACRYIGDLDWDPEERLSELLEGASTGGAATAGLDAMYLHILKRALTDGRNEAEVHELCVRFKHIVGAIVTSFDELSVPVLGRLLSVKPRQVDGALDRLHSVLDVSSDPESPIRLLHPSFHDFLVNETRCRDARFCIDQALMHGELVDICLETMSTALKRNSCRLPTPGSSPREVEDGMMDINLPKHVRYACEYWVDHLVGTNSDNRAQYVCDSGKVHSFLQKDFLHWLEAMSLMHRMPGAVLMITELANISELGPHRSLRAMAEDARRFVLRNRAIIEEAPLQVYVSALVFSPAESLIREFYLHQVPNWVNKLPATDIGWGTCVENLDPNGATGAIAFSPDGRYLACAVNTINTNDEDHVIKLWDAATGVLHSTLEGHQNYINALAFLHDGALASCSQDKTLRVWEPVTGMTRDILDVSFGATCDDPVDSDDEIFLIGGRAPGLSIMPNGDLAILCLDQNIRIWSRENQSLSTPVNRGILAISLFGCLSRGRLVFGNRRGVFLLDPNTSTVPISITTDELHVAVSSDDRIAWVPDHHDGTIWLLNTATNDISKLGTLSSPVKLLAFYPDGTSLIVGGRGNTLTSWELSTQRQSMIGTSLCPPSRVKFSYDGTQMAVGPSWPREIQLWDFSHRSLMPTDTRREIHDKTPFLQFSPHGTFIAVSTTDLNRETCMLKLYDTSNHQLVFACETEGRHHAISFSPNDEGLAVTSDDEPIYLWHPGMEMGDPTLSDSSSFFRTRCLAFSSDGKQLASGGENGHVLIWDPETDVLRYQLEHSLFVSTVIFSLDGTRLASLASAWEYDETVTARLWNTSTGYMLYEFDGLLRSLIAISPNNKYIAFQDSEVTVLVYDLESKDRRILGTQMSALAFSGDNQYVAITLCKSTSLWNISTAQRIAVFPLGSSSLSEPVLSFSADGDWLETHEGRFRIRQVQADVAGRTPQELKCWRQRDRWILEGERKMVWLPPEYEVDGFTHRIGMFASRHRGSYRLLGFSQDEVVLDV